MKTYFTPLMGIIFFSLILIGCGDSDNSLDEKTFEEQAISAEEKIKLALAPEYLGKLGISAENQAYLSEVYSSRNYKPFWINDSMLTDLGEKLKTTFEKPEQLGVPAKRHAYPKSKNFVQDEIANTLVFAQVVNDLKKGVLNYETKKKNPVTTVSATKLSSLIEFDASSDVRPQFLKFSVQDSNYAVLGKGLINWMDKYPMDEKTFKVRSIKIDTAETIKLATQSLISKGYLTVDNDTAAMFLALKEFQVQNGLKPDGVIGKYTSIALNESSAHRRDRIILAMDKMRSKAPYPEKYIRINIPEYKLRFYINDSLKSDHNIVVGRNENETPELTSKLNRIIVYPYWNVPYSISSKEILPAAKMNPNYFERHNYKIYKNGDTIDPLTVDWKSIRQTAFPYKVVQDPGRSNSLGIIKFNFPNSHSVYFHDTPSKSLFSTDVRAYSHGCMRTQNPVDLASRILERDVVGRRENDVMIPDSLDSIMARGENYTIKLIDPIPVYVEYVSVARVGEQMITHIDIYGRDEEYLKILTE
ncbi:MAG: L,D-transpeptidase family protein [Crocinitomicaceae bacterium]|nr:L,D-transpeptidase family protein [Crocinitomicaceae bacterium]